MIVGKVVGSVVSTRKNEKLIGNKFMIVEPVHHMKGDLSQIVAIDIIGAGIGEYVLVAQGSAARIGCGVETASRTLARGLRPMQSQKSVCFHVNMMHSLFFDCARLIVFAINTRLAAHPAGRSGIPDRPCRHTWNRYCSGRTFRYRTSCEAPWLYIPGSLRSPVPADSAE